MPNWCNNTVTFEGKPEVIEQVQQLFRIMSEKQEKENCGQLPDFLEGNDNSRYFFDFYENDIAVFNYQTKWSPNIETLEQIAEHFNVGFTLDYKETGNLIYGRATYENETLTDIYLEYEDFDQYEYDEETDTYHFEGEEYDSDYDILETLLERKIKNHFNNNKNQNNETIR